jgi:ABC-type lipoprotein release transport system permease subunit
VKLGFRIAWRDLFAHKSHNVINVISFISALGMAIGTAALVLILSIYNGFNGIIEDNLSDVDADLLVQKVDGKRFVPSGEGFDALFDSPQLASVSSVLTGNVFLMHEGKQAIAKAKGVDFVFEEESGISRHVIAGEWGLHQGDMPLASIGTELANKLGVNPRFISRLAVYYPSTDGNFSAANPLASLKRESLRVGSILSINAEIDAGLLILPIETLAKLLGTAEEEVSGVELRFKDELSGREQKRFIRTAGSMLGPSFKILDRYQQNSTLYKMMRYEKAAIWLILIFIVLIVALNIFASLSMLIIEKKDDIATLRAMGADDGLIKKIFVLEGWLVSLLGMLAGLLIGVALALVQQHFGIIKMPGSFLVSAYPVVLKLGDVLLAAAGVAAIGLLVALAPVSGRFSYIPKGSDSRR